MKGDPVQFIRRVGNIFQRAENYVKLEDEDNDPISAANPLPVDTSMGGTLEVDIDSIADVAGQEAMADSLPVVIASDQGEITVTLDGEEITLAVPTSGGWDDWFSGDLDESEEEVKGSAGVLGGIFVINVSDSVRWLKVFYAAAADVTMGTTPADRDLPIPTQGDTNGAGWYVPIPVLGMGFSNGLTLAATTTKGLDDDTALQDEDVIAWVWYK